MSHNRRNSNKVGCFISYLLFSISFAIFWWGVLFAPVIIYKPSWVDTILLLPVVLGYLMMKYLDPHNKHVWGVAHDHSRFFSINDNYSCWKSYKNAFPLASGFPVFYNENMITAPNPTQILHIPGTYTAYDYWSQKKWGQYRACVQCCYDTTGPVPGQMLSYESAKTIGRWRVWLWKTNPWFTRYYFQSQLVVYVHYGLYL